MVYFMSSLVIYLQEVLDLSEQLFADLEGVYYVQ